jgi:hypothetical protein
MSLRKYVNLIRNIVYEQCPQEENKDKIKKLFEEQHGNTLQT